MSETYQKVAYIGLRKEDGSYLMGVPLYIKMSDVNKSGLSDMQEDAVRRITDVMMKRYEQQFAEYVNSLKQKKNEAIELSKSKKGGNING